MLHQEPIRAFTPKVRVAFETYFNEEHTSARTLMNATTYAQYLHFLANPEQKIVEKDKIEKGRLHSEKCRAIKEYCVDSKKQLLNVAPKKRDITKPQAFVYDAFDHIKKVHADGGHNSYKKTYQQVKKEVFGISRAEVQWLLEHCQVYMLNRQNTTCTLLQPIVVREILARVQADLIDIRTKPDGKYVWILHLKDHFSKFSILYALTSKKASEITFYINLFARHLGIPGILQCDNGREFKGSLLPFLKKHNIKLINGRPQTSQTKDLVERANIVVKDKIAK